MTVHILLTISGNDIGPFSIYTDTDGFASPVESNVSKASLEAGYSLDVPDGTTVVRVKSNGDCTNYVDAAVGGGPIPSTSTTTSTTLNPFVDTWYYGTYNSPGGLVPIPTSVDIDISTGTSNNLVDPSGTIIIPFNSAIDDFIWFAIPVSAGTKSTWYVSDINQGAIGGAVSRFGNLFPDPVVVNYNGIDLNLYISCYRTNVVEITIS